MVPYSGENVAEKKDIPAYHLVMLRRHLVMSLPLPCYEGYSGFRTYSLCTCSYVRKSVKIATCKSVHIARCKVVDVVAGYQAYCSHNTSLIQGR